MNDKTRQKPVTPVQQWAWRHSVDLRMKVHDLDYFFWEATLKCNLNCRHCGSDCTRDQQITELPAEKVIEVFRNIAEHYDAKKIMVAVTGGEPLMRDDIFDVLAEIGHLGFPWGMVTNGMLVDEKVVQRCAETGMRTVSVSLDGDEDAHNWLRRNPQSFSKAVNAIKLFSQAGFLGLLGVISCAHPRNVDHLEKLYRFLRSVGVEEWRIFNIFPKGRAKINSELVSDGAMLEKVLSFIKAKRDEEPDYQISFCEEGYLGCSWERLVRDFPFYCGAGVNIGGLLCDGSYSACPSLSREWVQGNVAELPFHEAWETRYKNMRNRRWMKNDWCGDCREWKNCQGSSLHTWDWEENRPQMCHYRMLNERD